MILIINGSFLIYQYLLSLCLFQFAVIITLLCLQVERGIGISSYLLINFWFTRIQANKSAIQALVVNRVGDMSLSVGFFAIFYIFGNLDYSTVFSIAPIINQTLITIVGFLLLFASIGKSAQLGLHMWLPSAMEGRPYHIHCLRYLPL